MNIIVPSGAVAPDLGQDLTAKATQSRPRSFSWDALM